MRQSYSPLFLGEAGFVDIETHTEQHTFMLPSFNTYYGPFERGARHRPGTEPRDAPAASARGG